MILSELQKTIAAEMERQLLESYVTATPIRTPVGDGSKKKRYKRKRTAGTKNTVGAHSLGGVHQTDQCVASELEQLETCFHLLSFPDNHTPSVERNRNIIMSLSILEEIVEAAFVDAGLEPTPPFVPDKPNTTKNSQKRGDEIILIRPKDWKKRKEPLASSKPVAPARDPKDQPITRGGMFAPTAFTPNYEAEGISWPVPSEESNLRPLHPLMPESPEPTLPRDFYQPILDDFLRAKVGFDEELDGWPLLNRFQLREQSILSDFFREQNEISRLEEDDEEKLMAASTAASVASSTYKDPTVLAEVDDLDKITPNTQIEPPRLIATIQEDVKDGVDIDDDDEEVQSEAVPASTVFVESPATATRSALRDIKDLPTVTRTPEPFSNDLLTPRSPSPQAPLTPPPTLSPILVSLAELRELKRGLSLTPERKNPDVMETRSYSAAAASSLSGSSPLAKKKGLRTFASRDDLRIHTFRDDQNIKPRRKAPQTQRLSSDLQPSYRAAAIKSFAKPIASSKSVGLDFRSHAFAAVHREVPRDSCARSETALEGHREDPHWQNEFRRSEDFEIRSTTKDETTTITSALSHNREPEEIATLREERNSYRDMCLTLGAEVAKLKTMLAAQQATTVAQPAFEYGAPFGHPMHQPASFDPNGMQPFFYGIKRGQRLGPMSDAGVVRGGDHESQISEDDNFETRSKTRTDMTRSIPSGATVVGSDASVDFNNSNSALQNAGPVNSMPVDDPMHMHGLQSRLTKDILRFLDNINAQLKRQDKTRRVAVERFSRLVKAIWPRAQVKMYGSHVAGLCLPSSDLDFVVCLPAVHKNAPALAPGVLEGRNAINESSQKLLARELKGESWIDPRSIKLIERTVVPVIKVSTKDTRARVVQLDISFDSPEHHGLDANRMVAEILEELPLIRPLMLILKQFLLDRGLLTSYTGGISSYCLFLILARYLQEQTQSISDYGSLLMGFLDFHGNHFDPRATGISVRTRQYFVRPNDYQPGTYSAQVPIWRPPLPAPAPQHAVVVASSASVGPHDFRRRNSFSSETGSVNGSRGQGPPRFQNVPSARFQTHKGVPIPGGATGNPNHDSNLGHGRPFSFDPLFVEDPLSSGNNVGRNAFRIFQVQRAFSDAHRALVASLEWDIQSGELNEGFDSYPLLKCLLQSEDTLYEL
jgi:Nucleotidyltransferase domain/Cid1 family poly A polymerase